MQHFDLAVIGTGSGNSLVTHDFADKKVAIVEAGLFGGTCLNVGCIPTKMFVYAADVARTVTHAGKYGIDAQLDGVRWRDIRDRVFARIDAIEAGGREYRVKGPNTTAFLGHGRFTGERRIEVDLPDGPVEFTADQIVVAAGAHPMVPEAVSASGVPFQTSDTIMRIDELPTSVIILGGGFIAAEFAHVFSAFGVEVTFVTRGPALLRAQDAEISDAYTRLARANWNVRTGVEVTAARQDDGEVVLELTDGSSVRGGMLLVAAGREPNTAGLELACAGIETHLDGRVAVDEYGRTSAAGVWALGDVSSEIQLKHVANQEARTIAHNLVNLGDLRPIDHQHVPSAVFSHPQIATVGLTEKAARESGRPVTTKTQRYADVAYGWAMEDTTGICKIVADSSTGEILGAHLMGPQASTLIQPLIQAIQFGLTAPVMARGQYWIHPALPEVVENALLGLEFDDSVDVGKRL